MQHADAQISHKNQATSFALTAGIIGRHVHRVCAFNKGSTRLDGLHKRYDLIGVGCRGVPINNGAVLSGSESLGD